MVVIEDPLFVSLRVGGVTLATMHVREIDFFQLGVTEVVDAQEQFAEARRMYFPNLGSALGALLARALPVFGQPEHGSSWAHVYVVGELPEEELGTARRGQGTRAVSPLAAMRQVRVLREEDGTGRWLPVHLLRPFVPPDMPADAAQRRIDEALREGRHHSDEQLPREQRRKRPRPSDVVRAPRGGGPFVCKRGDPTKRRKVNTKAGMVFFVDRLGAMPHAIERVEREGPPGADYKVLCMRPILAETEDQDVRVPEWELLFLHERFHAHWCSHTSNARITEALERAVIAHAQFRDKLSEHDIFRSFVTDVSVPVPSRFSRTAVRDLPAFSFGGPGPDGEFVPGIDRLDSDRRKWVIPRESSAGGSSTGTRPSGE